MQNVEALTQEVEMRAILTQEQRNAIYERLSLETTFKGSKTLKDMYFCRKEVQSFDELEMVEIGSFSLRLREYTKNGTTKIELNTKVINQYNDHNSWEEHETIVSSFDETRAILNAIGFKDFFSIEKIRYTFATGNITINIEDIKDYKPIIEVEILTTQEKSNEAKKEIAELLQDLGVEPSQVVPKSVTNILMRERVKF